MVKRSGLDAAARWALVAVVMMLLGAAWLRLDDLHLYPPGITYDEATDAIDGFHIARSFRYTFYEHPSSPEPLLRLLMAGSSLLFGQDYLSFRFSMVMVGLLTVAAAYRATYFCLPESHRDFRLVAALAGAGVLAIALGHITLSRSLYRALLQPLFMLLYAAFLMEGLQTGKRRAFALSGFFLGLNLYTYLAALIVPVSLGLVALHLLILRWRVWRVWLPNMMVTGVIVAIFAAFPAWLLLTDSDRLLSRLQAVQDQGVDRTLEEKLERAWHQLATERGGDPNPQYNVARAPVVPDGFGWLFMLGLGLLVLRLHQPAGFFIAGLFVLVHLPILGADEIPHGVRSVGLFAVLPLVIGSALATLLMLLEKGSGYLSLPSATLKKAHLGFILSAIIITGGLLVRGADNANRTYDRSWREEGWFIYEKERTYAEWFFRADRRDFARWITAQTEPLLVPVEELHNPNTRFWLLRDFPEVRSAGADVSIPPDTRLVIPWRFDLFDLMRAPLEYTNQYALLFDGVITLLPPFTEATQAALLRDIDRAASVWRFNDDLLLRHHPLPADMVWEYLPVVARDTATPLAIYNEQLALTGWRGPQTVSGDFDHLTFALEWRTADLPTHYYAIRLGIVGQDYQGFTGKDIEYLPFLFPPTIWQPGDTAYSIHTLPIASTMLPPGAYRLLVGARLLGFADRWYEVKDAEGKRLYDSVTENEVQIAWVKVAQPTVPQPSPGAVPVEARVEEAFRLEFAQAQPLADGRVQISLFWRSLVERPPIDATIFVHVMHPSQPTPVGQDDSRPWHGQYPTFIWSAGEVIQTDHVVATGGFDLNTLEVYAGMYTFPDLTRLRAQQNGTPLADNRVRIGTLAELAGD